MHPVAGVKYEIDGIGQFGDQIAEFLETCLRIDLLVDRVAGPMGIAKLQDPYSIGHDYRLVSWLRCLGCNRSMAGGLGGDDLDHGFCEPRKVIWLTA